LPEAEGVEEVVQGQIRKIPPNKWNHVRILEELAGSFGHGLIRKRSSL
jgi:hypothetical protein